MNRYILIILLLGISFNSKGFQAQVAEKVYLHFDRNYYNHGDNIWFKAYIIDASTNKPSPNTNNLHVELISPAARILQSRTIRIESGTGNGDFSLPDSIPSGRYRVRAYTNYMRNFDEHFFFNKEIFIVNPADKRKVLNDSIEFIENQIGISFFPEGGSLVDNVACIVAFKAVNGLGKGFDVTGEVFSSKGELITIFKSSFLGMGTFNLKPVSGSNYYAVIHSLEGKEYRAELPKSFSDGVAMHLLVLQDNKLLLKIVSNDATLHSIKNRDMTIFLSSRNLITKTTKVKIATLINNFVIPLDEFPDGIIRVTLSGLDGIPLCERLIFLQKSKPVNLTITTDKPEYNPREQVKFKIGLTGDTLLKDKGFFSLSAADSKMISDSTHFPSSIASWFLLESDVRGPVEEPSSYFDNTNENRLQNLDLLLLTQGWRDFEWKFDSDKLFKHEIGFTLSGKVRRIMVNKPLKGARVNFGIFSNNFSALLSTEPDSSGNFRIGGIDLTGSAKAIVSVTDKKDAFNGYLILDTPIYKSPGIDIIQSRKLALSENKYSELRNEAIDINNIKKKYNLNDTIGLTEVVVTARKREQARFLEMVRSHYMKPDEELIVTPELELRSDIFNVLAGRVPGVEVSGKSLTVRGTMPLLLRDGIPIGGEEFSMIPPATIDRIDVLYWSSLFGSQGANGILNVITKRGDFNYDEIKLTHSANFNMKGFDAPRIFYSPKYYPHVPVVFSPDIRSTIFWEPNIVIRKGQNVSLSCFTADGKGIFEVNVTGFTAEGIPVSSRTQFEVK